MEEAADQRRSDRFGTLHDYFGKIEQDYLNDHSVFFVEWAQFLDIPIMDQLYWEDDEDQKLTLAMIDIYRDEITTAIDELTRINIPIFFKLIKSARKKAYNIQGFLEEPESSLEYDDFDCDMELKGAPDVFYYLTSQVSCKCGMQDLAFSFPMNHMCLEYEEVEDNLSVDPRRIYALWKLLDLLGLDEDYTEEDLSELGECFECKECLEVKDTCRNEFDWTRAVSDIKKQNFLSHPDDDFFRSITSSIFTTPRTSPSHLSSV